MATTNYGFHRNEYNPPETVARTCHSLSIVVKGKRIGLINGWNPQQSRDVTPIYEINVETSGLPLENIPGNVRGLTIAINRYDIWLAKMEDAFGTVDLTMLSNQKAPFSVQEEWTYPDGVTKEVWEYSGVYFTNIGRNYRSDDQRIVNVSAQLVYVHKARIQ